MTNQRSTSEHPSRSKALAHLKPGDIVLDGATARLVPAGTVERVTMEKNPTFPNTDSREGHSSHLFVVSYADGRSTRPLDGSRRVVVQS